MYDGNHETQLKWHSYPGNTNSMYILTYYTTTIQKRKKEIRHMQSNSTRLERVRVLQPTYCVIANSYYFACL